MSSWYDQARGYIRAVDAGLPADISFEDRKKAVSAAYPWGERKMWPYKAWLRAQKEYLGRFVKSDASVHASHLSPLEKMMRQK